MKLFGTVFGEGAARVCGVVLGGFEVEKFLDFYGMTTELLVLKKAFTLFRSFQDYLDNRPS